ncbi:hypothetical protein GmHk_14G041510 [Glycine max]|nr:hypothetical protein GmHk_14G041510 [Glycine max]
MVDRGRGGGRKSFNHGRRCGVSLRAPITTNPFTSSIHISTSELMIQVIALAPNTLPIAQDQPNSTFVRELIPTTPIGDASPSTSNDSLTLEYPPNPNYEHTVDHRPFICAYKGEFQPTYGCSNIILDIIREKFDELVASWLKKEYRWFLAKERAIRAIFETKEEGTSIQDSPNIATLVNDNEIYLNVVGGPNYKGNVYKLSTLSKRFNSSKSAPSTSIGLVKMCEIINKLNVELLAKADKEKTLEEKMLQLMENYEHQSQEMRQQVQEQNEQMQRILQHLYIQCIMSAPSPSITIADEIEHHVDDAQVDRSHDMSKDH